MRTRAVWATLLGVAAAQPAAAADIQAITSSTNAYVAPRSDGAVSRSGVGGIVFTIQATGAATALHGAAFHGTQFVAVGDGGRIVRSSNTGLDWSPDTSPVTTHLRATARHGTYFLAVGDAGTTLRAVGVSTVWDTTLSPGAKSLRALASNGEMPGIVVAVGDDGTALRSTDQGLSWSRQIVTGAPDFRGVTAGVSSNVFIAVGLGGAIFRSTDFGITWTGLDSPVTDDLYAVAVNGANRFVAAGAGGTVLRSIGGTEGSWFTQSFPVGGTLRGAYHDGNYFYVVGDAEIIARSQDGTTWFQVAIEPTSWSDVKIRFR